MKEIETVAIIGVGRVAEHLGIALYNNGIEIVGVYGRKADEAKVLAAKMKSPVIEDITKRINADLILLAIADDAISEVSNMLHVNKRSMVAHTSGAVSMADMSEKLRRAVFYPLQSFSKDKKIVWENVPFCIEAENDDDINALGDLAERLSKRVYVLSSAQRKTLHLAAVFANNFANLMFEFSEELLAKADIDHSILHPLILETATKVLMQSASDSQTGPASRGDVETIKSHQSLLGDDNTYRKVYDLLTSEIYMRNHDEKL